MIIRCLLCHGVIQLGAYTRKGWCKNCGCEWNFEIFDDCIIMPDCLVVEELKMPSIQEELANAKIILDKH